MLFNLIVIVFNCYVPNLL